MKKGKEFEGNKNKRVFIFIFLLLIGVIAFGYFTGFFGKITVLVTKNLGINITIGVPFINEVMNGTATMSLAQAPLSTSREINFTVYNVAGTQFLNDSTAKINITLIGGVGEVVRNQTGACTRYNSSANYATYTCNMTMWWFDGSGYWNISASILDNNSNAAYNSSTTLFVGATTGFEMSPVNLTWPGMGAGSINQTSDNDPMNLTNIGNQLVGNASGTSNISINATDLKGETNNLFMLYAENFSVWTATGGSPPIECDGGSAGNLSKNMFANTTSAVLPKGNYTIGDINTGREQLWYCLRIAGADLPSQAYSTLNMTPWTIKIY